MSKYCQKCGTENEDKAKKCVKCGKKFKKPWYKKVWVWILAAIVSISIVSCATSSSTKTTKPEFSCKECGKELESGDLCNVCASRYTTSNKATDSDVKTQTSTAASKTVKKRNTPKVTIKYVKRANSLTTASGSKKPSENHEVIIAYVEAYNCSNKDFHINFDNITCYADGIQVGSIETYIKVKEDGISQLYSTNIIPGYSAISAQDFEVPLNWTTLTFFYNDQKTEFTQEEVTAEPFTMTYNNIPEVTASELGTELKGNNYTVIYDGFETTASDNQFDDDNYIRVMFTITNRGTESLKTSLMGHRMQMYQNGYLMPDANFATLEDYNGYKNIFSLDSVAPGMSAKIFIGFERQDLTTSEFTLVYNDGYILDNELGLIYIKE